METNNVLREMVIAKMKNGEYELKPCPFCGGKPKLMGEQFFNELVAEYGSALIDITCSKCNLQLADHSDAHDYYVRAFIVSEKWNRRAE